MPHCVNCGREPIHSTSYCLACTSPSVTATEPQGPTTPICDYCQVNMPEPGFPRCRPCLFKDAPLESRYLLSRLIALQKSVDNLSANLVQIVCAQTGLTPDKLAEMLSKSQ